MKNEFRNPGAAYRPQPFWFLNHCYDKDQLCRQLEEMHLQGVGGVVLHSRHGKGAEFLSEDYMQMLEYCMQICERLGMLVWLYDEDNWPSGTVGGKLTREHPSFRMKYLRVETLAVLSGKQRAFAFKSPVPEGNRLLAAVAYPVEERDGNRVKLVNQPVFAASADLDQQWGWEWEAPGDAEYVLLAYWECETDERLTFGSGYYLDTMNPAAVQAFMNAAYEPLERFSRYFGTVVQGVFTDEPGLMAHDGFFGVEAIKTTVEDPSYSLPGYILPWTEQAVDRFKEMHGRDLLGEVAGLVYRMADGSCHAGRQRFYDTVTRWYIESYHEPLRHWCESRGLCYIGHTLEEPLWGQARSQGNQLKVLESFTYPGLDYLQAGIGDPDHPHRILSVKCASSVAYLKNRERVICEAFGASNHEYSMRQRRLDANFMSFLGVNLFIPHAFYYSFAGHRKTDFPQTEFYHAPHWPHYRHFADYTARLSLLGAKTAAPYPVVIVSPIRTVYREMFDYGEARMSISADELFAFLSDRLLRAKCDYIYADESQLAALGTPQEAAKRIPAVILPEVSVIDLHAMMWLEAYMEAGGIVAVIGAQAASDRQCSASGELKAVWDRWESTEGCGGRLLLLDEASVRKDNACGLVHVLAERSQIPFLGDNAGWHSTAPDRFFVKHTVSNDGTSFFWVLNTAEHAAAIRYEGMQERWEEWHLENGSCSDASAYVSEGFSLESGEMRIFCRVSATAGKTEKGQKTIYADKSAEIVAELDPAQFFFHPAEPNVLLLDRWEVILNDRQSRMKTIMPGQTNTYRTRFMVEPGWLKAVQEDPSAYVRLILDEMAQYIPAHIGFLTRRRNLELYLNGVRLDALQPSAWQDPFYRQVELKQALIPGENELELLTFSLLEPMQGLHYPAYLTGNFGIEGQTIGAAPERGAADWAANGFPHYSGVGVYTTTVTLGPEKIEGKKIVVRCSDIRESAVLYVNNVKAGTCLWPPYEWDCTGLLKSRSNDLKLCIANTLDNLYNKHPAVSGLNGTVTLVSYS
ncbi:beta-galactosidase [Paenibacillus sp. GCM10027626]|uniref:beta-galactosidase n=1 Tax=Paenibacillus sp. GCM10027626 TaxID=3273411 RepID=UPI00362C9702